MTKDTTQRNVVKELMDKIDTTKDTTQLNVIRGKVLDGARRAIKRPSFDPERPLSLKFMDDGGSSEGAVDEGGPRREFFTLALRELNGGNMFAGPTREKFIIPNHRGKTS